MYRQSFFFILLVAMSWGSVDRTIVAADFRLQIEQITQGPQTHLFGYIGHVQNIPWNGTGRYILALRSNFHDKMPGPDDPADVVLIDTENRNRIRVLDQCRAWNPQQGTMFYWNPDAPDTQFFFNDRDRTTGKVFCVLFDLSKGENGARIREYRFEDTPVGNGGVAQQGGYFLGINYARMARLRPVTGYAEATDWTKGIDYPKDDGVFRVDVKTGEKKLLVSFETIAKVLNEKRSSQVPPLFINHTLNNRENDRVFFFARAGWNDKSKKRINQPFVVAPDGKNLTMLKQHIGGHPEWDNGQRMIGHLDGKQVIYDVDRQAVVSQMGNPDIFPNPEGDVALSPNGKWFVNGFKDAKRSNNFYVVFRKSDGSHVRSRGFNIGEWKRGDLRQDPSPCWNRTSDKILVPAVSEDGNSRQLFVISIIDPTQK